MSKPTVISTFSGPGGSSIGYERAGFDVRVALDNAPDGFSNDIIPTYKKNHPDTTHIPQDARQTDPKELLNAANLDVGELDVLDGSPPCSPFSSSNTQVEWGDHKSGTLFDTYTYFVDQIRPKAFVAENVPGLAQGKTKGYFKQLYQNLTNAGSGYNLNVQKIDAAYLGASHHRRRLMFIGVREDIGQPPKIEPNKKPTTVRKAWEGLERDPDNLKRAKSALERSELYEEYASLAPGQTLSDAKGIDYGFTQYRWRMDRPAPTITANSSHHVHPEEDRLITIGELKRGIGLPDDYEVPNKRSPAWEVTCRCLPPILLETIGRRLKEDVL